VGHRLELGKDTGRDAALGRPSSVRAHGVDATRRRVAEWLDEAHARLPECETPGMIEAWLDRFASRLGAT
jgi:hypothetical protein